MKLIARKHLLVLVAAAALSVPVWAQTAAAGAAAPARTAAKPAAGKPAAVVMPQPGAYKVDVAHTHAYFFVSHLGVSRFMGRFDDIQGSFTVGESPEKSRVSVTIPVASINAKHQKLEEHLKSPDFFDAAQFPNMHFESSRVRWNARGDGVLAGNLTIHGVTRPVEFALKVTGAGKGPRGDTRAGFEATLTIKRSDYGMNYGLPKVVGDAVEINMSVEGVLQQ